MYTHAPLRATIYPFFSYLNTLTNSFHTDNN